jgi:hypothetical protein
MALYSGCILLVQVPLKYPKKDALVRFLKSRFEGCEIKTDEVETDEPAVERGDVSEKAQLNGLQIGREWTSPSRPPPMVNDAAKYLFRAGGEAIREFIETSHK